MWGTLGMYAQRIYLVGSDQGFAVNNAGIIATGATGRLTLDNTGKLTNQKTGQISAGVMDATVDVLHNQGYIEQLGLGNLGITSIQLDNKAGAVLGASLYDEVANNPSIHSACTSTSSSATPSNQGINAKEPMVQTINKEDGAISSKTLINDGGKIVGASVSLTTNHLNNQNKSSIHLDRLKVAQGNFTNNDARIHAHVIDADVDTFYHQKGQITADIFTLTADDIHHSADETLSASRLTLSAHGNIINTGDLNASDLTLSGQNLTNTGLINGNNTHLDIQNTLDNKAKARIYGDKLSIQAATLNNTPSAASGIIKSPIIAARARLDLGVHALNNNPNPDRVGKFNRDFDGQA